MDKQLILKIIFIVSLIGVLFSGYMTMGEMLLGACPAGGCNMLLGVPVCLYGFIMYLILLILSILGLKSSA